MHIHVSVCIYIYVYLMDMQSSRLLLPSFLALIRGLLTTACPSPTLIFSLTVL